MTTTCLSNLLLSILVAAAAACGSSAGAGVDDDGTVGGDDDGGGGGDDDGGSGDDEVELVVRIDNIAPWTVLKSGAVTTKVSGQGGPLSPGEAFEIELTAGAKQAVSFAAMLGESNDWFFAPGEAGIALYDDAGAPRTGDVTAEVQLWDAGTEVDEEPGIGGSTGPQQGTPDQGASDPDPTVRVLGPSVTLSDGSQFARPAVADMIRVSLTAGNDRRFTLRIENVSDETALVTSQGSRIIHVSPAVWALHIAPAPLFDEGAADRGEGLEHIAEAGRTATLAASMRELTGFATPVSPGVYVVASEGEPLYSVGLADRGLGLERIAEDGDPMPLAEAVRAAPPTGAVADGVFETPAGNDEPGPARPGSGFEFTITAGPGDHLAFATMFGMSNDWFFGTPAGGIPLVAADGTPTAGDVTSQIAIYDAGSELDQELAIGSDTAPQQSGPDVGAPDPVAQVRALTALDYPATASSHLRVTITPAQ
jgi:hypothetical protein